jgi:hypothetical protein
MLINVRQTSKKQTGLERKKNLKRYIFLSDKVGKR